MILDYGFGTMTATTSKQIDSIDLYKYIYSLKYNTKEIF